MIFHLTVFYFINYFYEYTLGINETETSFTIVPPIPLRNKTDDILYWGLVYSKCSNKLLLYILTIHFTPTKEIHKTLLIPSIHQTSAVRLNIKRTIKHAKRNKNRNQSGRNVTVYNRNANCDSANMYVCI